MRPSASFSKKNIAKSKNRGTMCPMAEFTQMGIRITKDQREALEKIAEKAGVDVSQLIRFGIDALIKHYHRCGEKLVLPIDFSDSIPLRPSAPVEAPDFKAPAQPKAGKTAA